MITAFCNDIICKGEPVSFTDNIVMGNPEAIPYNGQKFCGVTLHNVAPLDLTKQVQRYDTVDIGGAISVIRFGTISIDKYLIFNQSKISFNKFIKPVNGYGLSGWKVQKKRKRTSVALIEEVHENYIVVILF